MDRGRRHLAFPLPIFKSPIIYDGTAGDDVLISRFTTAVNEFFYGYAGNDYIDGGLGADRMFGGAGHDTYVVDNAGDVVTENAGEGFDTVRVSFSYTIPLNVERLELTGTAAINATGSGADDRLYGNVSSNILWGNGGNDILNGREGTDTMLGGTGNDTYYVDNAGDVVVEYANEGTDWVATTISYTLGHNLENLSFLWPATWTAPATSSTTAARQRLRQRADRAGRQRQPVRRERRRPAAGRRRQRLSSTAISAMTFWPAAPASTRSAAEPMATCSTGISPTRPASPLRPRT